MSNSTPTTATPFRHRLKRARLRFLPLVFFTFACSASFYLWQFQNSAVVEVGLVEIQSHDVISPGDGKIERWASPDGKPFPVNSFVNENEIVAVLDDASLRSSLLNLSRQLSKLRETVSLELQGEAADPSSSLAKAWNSIESYSSSADKKIECLNQELALRNINLELAMLKKSAVEPEEMKRLQQLQIKRATMAAQLTPWQSFGLAEADVQVNDIFAINEREFENSDQLLFLKLRETCQSIDAQLNEARLAADSLDIVTPFRGQVERTYVRANENVSDGDPVLTLTAVKGNFVVVYARENSGLLPTPGSPVVLGVRGNSNAKVDSVVQSVGAKIVAIPARQRLNSNVEEWGRAMRIPIPDDFSVVPGSLVDVTFFPGRKGYAAQNTTAQK